MKEYIEWLKNRIEICLEDKDLQREHWAFCQALTKMRELQLLQPDVIKSVCDRVNNFENNRCINCGAKAGHKCELQTVL